MVIKKKNILTGNSSTMDLPVTEEQLFIWKKGMPIQICMPHLNVQQREFLISGMSLEEQNNFFNIK